MTAMVVVFLVLPEIPVMVIVDEPVASELLAVNQTVPVPVVGLVANDAVTPLGRPRLQA